MSEKRRPLQRNWREVKFGDVVRQIKDSVEPETAGLDRYVAGEHMDTDDLRIRRWGEVGTGYLGPAFHMRFKPGQVLYGSRRTYLRKVAVPDFEGICANTTFVLEPKDPAVLLPEFLPFLMRTDAFNNYSVKNSKGSVNPYINFSDLARFEFVLPSTEEQYRMLDPLRAGQSVSDELREAIEALQTVRLSMEKRLLSVATPKRPVGDVAKFTSGKSIRVSDLPKAPSPSNPIPVFGGNGISGYTSHPLEGTDNPTVVVGRVGQFCGVTSLTTGPCWITDNGMYACRLAPEIQPHFLAIYLRAVDLNRSKLGEYLPLITQAVVHKVEIPMLDIESQQTVIREFAQVDRAEAALIQQSSRTRSLMRTVANQLIMGEPNGV